MIIGKILKPQGIRGELKIKPQVDEQNFKEIKSVQIDGKTYTIKSVSVREGYAFVMFNEIKNRNEAEEMRDKDVCVLKEELLPLKEDQFYVDDLIGCVIKTEEGEKLGKVFDVQNYGASDILTIRDGSEEILCPFLSKVFVSVDVENKTIIVNKKHFLEVTQSENWCVDSFSKLFCAIKWEHFG